jgi:hypothetical protein
MWAEAAPDDWDADRLERSWRFDLNIDDSQFAVIADSRRFESTSTLRTVLPCTRLQILETHGSSITLTCN